MIKSESINELAAALSKAQGAMTPAIKDSNNPFFKSSYADLASVWDACRKPLTDNGLSVVQTLDDKKLETILLHSSGQYITSTLNITAKEETSQSIGSAITYARRYALSAMVGICPDDDDDGEAAMGRKADKKKQPESARQPTDNTGAPETKEHWCEKHNVAFFKSAKMKSYAHPIAGTKEWCNEPTIAKVEEIKEAMQTAVEKADSVKPSTETVQKAPEAVKSPQQTAQATPHAETIKPPDTEQYIVDIAALRADMKKARWNDVTAYSWLQGQYHLQTIQNDTLGLMLGRLKTEQVKEFVAKMKDLASLSGK